MDFDLIYALLIGVIVFSICYTATYFRLGMPKRPAVAISACFGLIVMLFLIQNPAILADTITRIALILIGAVIELALLVRRTR
ncbi:MAG: hypothetical protein JXB15_02405 [Anaerolineales bacterium]|nr:hypothetical protein [Anaerolineales bacterium]